MSDVNIYIYVCGCVGGMKLEGFFFHNFQYLTIPTLTTLYFIF